MTPDSTLTDGGPSPSDAPVSNRRRIRDTVHTLAWEFKHDRWSNGELARLRRLEIRRPDSGSASGVRAADITFAQVQVRHLEPHLIHEQSEDFKLCQWTAIVQGLARAYRQHSPNVRLGAALKLSGISDQRLSRLLRASGFPLWLETRRLAHFLVSKGQRVDWADVAELITSEGTAYADETRRSIASDYKRTRTQSDDSNSDNKDKATDDQ